MPQGFGSFGFTGRRGEHMKVLRTPPVHNLVVCTCAPVIPGRCWDSPQLVQVGPYRARAVIIPEAYCGIRTRWTRREIKVWDSTSEMRYMVLPGAACRERGLARMPDVLVSRNSMMGWKIHPPQKGNPNDERGHDLGGSRTRTHKSRARAG
ncbi:MAG: hypothetical protein CM1200mP18_07640 [Gammaproteobacteria bacterium]|nr:MAG: hypothetical protein CM1200mP18_07640 [Gammaproteobacteria bacterium]